MSVSSVIVLRSRNVRCTSWGEPRWRQTDPYIQSYFAIVLFGGTPRTHVPAQQIFSFYFVPPCPQISRAKYWLFHSLFSASCFNFLCMSNLRKLCALSSRCLCLGPFLQFFSPIRDARCSLLCRRRCCVARCFSLSWIRGVLLSTEYKRHSNEHFAQISKLGYNFQRLQLDAVWLSFV
jgi:hypothetical protein